MSSKKPYLLAALLVLILVLGCTAQHQEGNELAATLPPVSETGNGVVTPPATVTPAAQPAKEVRLYEVTRVVDGDTIEVVIEGKLYKVRYTGINTPEMSPIECFGQAATDKNRALVEGKKVRLEKDISETDRYGRLLRYIYLEDGTFVNEVLVAEGYAQVATYPPDVKYQDLFLAAEREARKNNRGLWSACLGEQSNKPAEVQSPGPVKGNISKSGEKIYHVPGCPDYDKTVIDESRGERFFGTEEEAVANGWRKAGNCPK